MYGHTDANVQPQGNPWDANEPDWSTPVALPTDEQVDAAAKPLPGAHVLNLAANPLREYLEAIGRELLIAKGDRRQAWQEAMELALEHSYGLEPHEAERKVADALRTAERHLKEDAAEGLEWDAVKYDRARDLVTWMVLR